MPEENGIIESLTTEERSRDLNFTIDPGFVNRRKIETLLGEKGMQVIDRLINQLPATWNREIRIEHIYTRAILRFCKVNKVCTLEAILANPTPLSVKGVMFCSTEKFAPCRNVYDTERANSKIIPKGNCDYKIEVQYSTKHIFSDTQRSELYEGEEMSLIAELHGKKDNLLIFHPFIIGAPCLITDNPKWKNEIMFWGYEFGENFIEDFDEFNKIKSIEKPVDINQMKYISEKAFKICLTEILGNSAKKDWGGERSDHYTAHLHLNGKRVTAAFLLKGPGGGFRPMGLNHLGKKNDQIYRLAQEPADIFFVQHCHEITPPVRATLRAFVVQPSCSRRYCLIDGRDSLSLLKAYNLYERALELSNH
jgi:hypothetical protein